LPYVALTILPVSLPFAHDEYIAAMDEDIDSCEFSVKEKIDDSGKIFRAMRVNGHRKNAVNQNCTSNDASCAQGMAEYWTIDHAIVALQ
jgi:hypothetical protein